MRRDVLKTIDFLVTKTMASWNSVAYDMIHSELKKRIFILSIETSMFDAIRVLDNKIRYAMYKGVYAIMSGKCAKARKYGTIVMTESDFLGKCKEF